MTSRSLHISLDQGGHSSRAIAFDGKGRLVAATRREVAEQHPAPDRVEQDPEGIVTSLRECLGELCEELGEEARQIVNLGLATQRSSLVCWNSRTGAALSPVLSWQDRRAATWLAAFQAEANRVRSITGLFLSPHYGVSKMAWCLGELPEVRSALVRGELRIGPLASFLALRLLDEGEPAIDPCNAGRTLLYDLQSMDWSEELLELFRIPREVLPTCRSTRDHYGMISTRVGDRPLAIMSGDQPAALYAHGAPRADCGYVNLGTGAFVLRTLHAPERAPERLLASVSYSDSVGPRFVAEGTVNGAASALDRMANELGVAAWQQGLNDWLESNAELPLFLNGVSGVGSPYWNSHFESSWVGAGSSEAKLAAVAESVLFLVERNLEELASLEPPLTTLRVTGGLSNSNALCQRLANLSARPVERPVNREATARGTAFWLAGEPEHWPQLGEPVTFEPDPDPALLVRYARWRDAMPKV